MRQAILAACLLSLMGVIGCAADTGGSLQQEFAVGFDTADARLRQLYPPMMSHQPLKADPAANGPRAKLDGPLVSIRRDELSASRQELIVIEERSESPVRRTLITLREIAPGRSQVAIQASVSRKAVLLPDRDEAFEAARMEEIASVLRQDP